MRHARMSLDAPTSSNENSTALVRRDGTSLKPSLSKKVVVAAVLGNALEFYDFAAYAFFAVYIGQAFFPASTPSPACCFRWVRSASASSSARSAAC